MCDETISHFITSGTCRLSDVPPRVQQSETVKHRGQPEGGGAEKAGFSP